MISRSNHLVTWITNQPFLPNVPKPASDKYYKEAWCLSINYLPNIYCVYLTYLDYFAWANSVEKDKKPPNVASYHFFTICYFQQAESQTDMLKLANKYNKNLQDPNI